MKWIFFYDSPFPSVRSFAFLPLAPHSAVTALLAPTWCVYIPQSAYYTPNTSVQLPSSSPEDSFMAWFTGLLTMTGCPSAWDINNNTRHNNWSLQLTSGQFLWRHYYNDMTPCSYVLFNVISNSRTTPPFRLTNGFLVRSFPFNGGLGVLSITCGIIKQKIPKH